MTIRTTRNQIVDWGDGNQDTITAYDQAEKNHTYAVAGDYVISIVGRLDHWDSFYAGTNTNNKIQEIQAWGSIQWRDLSAAFFDCPNVTMTATDAPDLSLCKYLFGTFQDAFAFQDVNNSFPLWDTSTIERLQSFLERAYLCNGDISG